MRPGLKFHDGQPVTTRDVIASLKRWMVRDVLGQAMTPFVEEFQAIDDKTFVLRLKRAVRLCRDRLGDQRRHRAGHHARKGRADRPYKSITEAVGSGPFKFVAAEWNPGAKTVYVKNPDYVPRSDPPDGNAGAKIAKVDRVEWIVLPDPFTKSSAIQRGEVDIIDQLPNDQIPVLEKNKDIVIDRTQHLAVDRLYPAEPPLPAVRQPEGAAGPGDGGQPGGISRRALATSAGGVNASRSLSAAARTRPRRARRPIRSRIWQRAKTLLQEAGYKGEKVVLIDTHEIASIGALGDVTANNLRKIGINVELADSDWGTLVARRAKKDPPDKGGWNLFHTTSSGASVNSPLTNFTIDSGCGRANWFGWPCDEEVERLRATYVTAPDDTARKAALVALHRRLWETLPTIPIGQYMTPYAARSNIKGILKSNPIVFWNIDKE